MFQKKAQMKNISHTMWHDATVEEAGKSLKLCINTDFSPFMISWTLFCKISCVENIWYDGQLSVFCRVSKQTCYECPYSLSRPALDEKSDATLTSVIRIWRHSREVISLA